ncbi:hypothetical protein RN001_013873 [Aquatica leii]|uniref:Craniofacial development protein 2 n=1 Tax=Aquatica leii TaxID=1421715 RepID=A0AAN7SLS7_9COLE|nr:hypothetical protein RN001_013873 [Aquatica leii]
MKQIEWNIVTFNIRTLRDEEKLIELEAEIKKIKWTIIGLAEVRRTGEQCIKLKSRHVLFSKGREDKKEGGVGLLINKTEVDKVSQYKAISERVISIVIDINKRYKCKVIQVYAPTLTQEDEEIEKFYEKNNEALKTDKTRYTIIMDNFNANVGIQEEPNEQGIGPFGLGKKIQ